MSLDCDIYFFMPQGTRYIMKLTNTVRLNEYSENAIEMEINIITVTQGYFTPGFSTCSTFF